MTAPRQEAFRNLFRIWAVPGSGLHHPMRCVAGPAELAEHPGEHPEWRGNTDKVMFACEKDAQGFAEGVAQFGEDRDGAQVAYYCPRGGHWHLKNAEKAQARLERLKPE